ncbi:MAG: hypothetical protein HFH68_03160 [Lachnospiraceae bacterium]|nr:hypothetical protein [Lachnospiraceae bacterium]
MKIARQIRETDANIQLVFCTSSNGFASESYKAGAQYYILKQNISIMSGASQIPINHRKSKDVQNSYIKFCSEQMRKEIYL